MLQVFVCFGVQKDAEFSNIGLEIDQQRPKKSCLTYQCFECETLWAVNCSFLFCFLLHFFNIGL